MTAEQDNIATGQLVRIEEAVKDFYPDLIGKLGVVLDITQYAGDTLTGNKEFTLLVGREIKKIKNYHSESTAPIDGLEDIVAPLTDKEIFTIIKR
jgi:hypothetical protein|tara:strand:- start:107 stop:391 length:285 start_codon:yes stop_codon:yes gene_type:complete